MVKVSLSNFPRALGEGQVVEGACCQSHTVTRGVCLLQGKGLGM